MYKCPHCGNRSISIGTAALFKPPFDGSAVCPICGTHLRLRWTISRFLFPLYMLTRSVLGLAFHINFDLGFVREMTIAVILVVLQFLFMSYKEVSLDTGK
jgi:predicted RNA-binding Zn-ribbon protein involved in translation (DUF1610 family)